MDGPNVNWKFYTDLTKERNSEELPQLLNIGSCGLHIVHGGLQKGVNESGWKLGHLMRSLWQLFHDTPARREDFVKLTGSTVFPLKFCPPNGSLLGAVIDGPLHRERCPGAG